MKIKKNISKWSFDNIPESYDSHLKRSIPLYQESQFFVSKLVSFYIKDENINYEIGCANGTIIGNLAREYLNFKKTKFVGIDLSNKLILEAKKRYKKSKNLNFYNIDASTYNYKKCNVAIIHYVLQFMTLEERRNLLNSLYSKLINSGAIIIFEKILMQDSYSQDIFTGIYNDFKFDNEYSPQEVIKKSLSLRSVMRSITSERNLNLFKSIGFSSIYTFFKWGPFEGYLCVK
jgi:tRNA (cmo5U34)-methyltransferase|tara:strand:- start:966 stop:1661 length:696 start_codon:yes stop_codon:yes gene_type:complete